MTDNSCKITNKPLVGKAITLRPITMEDTPLIVKWRNTESVRQNFIYREPFTEAIHTNWMNTKVASGEVLQFIMVDNESGEPVGSAYLRDVDYVHSSAEYGMFIGDESARGKGFGREAAELLSAFGFNELKLHRISLRILGDNQASISSCRRAGFEVEGIFRDMLRLDGKYNDVVFMARLNDREKEV